jgi:hypothetical protein
MIIRNFVTRLPVEKRGGKLYTLGVKIMLNPPCRIPDDLNPQISKALVATHQAEGVNMPVTLDHGVWLLRCKRCQAPFIGPSEAKLCGDECRAAAKRDSVRRASAKRSVRRSERNETRICRHCERQTPTTRTTKRFCSVACRVAWHRGSPSPAISALDRQIAEWRQFLVEVKRTRAPFRRAVKGRIVALQAERAKLMAEHPATDQESVSL